jgi:hypothetical protein
VPGQQAAPKGGHQQTGDKRGNGQAHYVAENTGLAAEGRLFKEQEVCMYYK